MKETGRLREHRRQILRALGVLLGGVAVMTVVACTPIDRLSVRYSDGKIEFASCHTVEANVMWVSVRSDSGPDSPVRIWQVEGDIRVRPGDVFALGQDIGGLTTVLDDVVPSSAGEIYFSLGRIDETGEFGDARSARFFVADIREGEWTRSNGSRGDEPCEQPS